MTISTLNEDEFAGDAGKSPEEVLADVEEFANSLRQGDTGVAHETRPAGYGTLLTDYEWRQFQGQPGTAPFVRAWCLLDAQWMGLTLKVDPRYGKAIRNGVEYNGTPVQAWHCGTCGKWTVK